MFNLEKSMPRYHFASLTDIFQYRFKHEIVDKALSNDGNDAGLAVLILDDKTMKFMEPISMSQLTEWGVTAVVNVKYQREPIRLTPIYFLSPSSESVQSFINDWENARFQQYNIPVHLFFSAVVEKPLIDRIVHSKVSGYLKTFASVSMFQVVGSHSYLVDAPENILSVLYHEPNADVRRAVLKKMANQVASMFIMFRMNPQIVYSSSSPNNICTEFKNFVVQMYNEIKESIANYEEEEERPLFMIVDRSVDPLAPAMYDLHYESAMYDLLDVADNNTIKTPKGVAVELSEKDPVWQQSRFKHVGEVSQKLPRELNRLKETNAAGKFQEAKKTGAQLTSDEYMAALRDQGEYKEKAGALSTHVQLVNKVLDVVMEKEIIRNLIDLQQDLATTIDENCKSVSPKHLVGKVQKALQKGDLNEMQKLRLLIALVCGVPASHAQSRGSLFQLADISPDLQMAYTNIAKLGVDLRDGQFKTLRVKQEFVRHYAKLQKNGFVFRHVPLLFFHLNEAIKGKLKSKFFAWEGRQSEEPFIPSEQKPKSFRDAKSVRSGKKKEEKESPDEWPKVFVFFLGGATRSEMRVAKEVVEHYKHNVYIGSSTFWKPNDYVRQLATMGSQTSVEIR